MSNMSYCRFRNTLQDLRDCLENIHSDDLSEDEFKARKHLIGICQLIVEEDEKNGISEAKQNAPAEEEE